MVSPAQLPNLVGLVYITPFGVKQFYTAYGYNNATPSGFDRTLNDPKGMKLL
jgi:hypothetical protein